MFHLGHFLAHLFTFKILTKISPITHLARLKIPAELASTANVPEDISMFKLLESMILPSSSRTQQKSHIQPSWLPEREQKVAGSRQPSWDLVEIQKVAGSRQKGIKPSHLPSTHILVFLVLFISILLYLALHFSLLVTTLWITIIIAFTYLCICKYYEPIYIQQNKEIDEKIHFLDQMVETL